MNTSERKTDADLNAYVDDQLDGHKRMEMEAWLAVHPEDAKRVEVYRKQNEELHNLFDSVIDEPIPSGLSDLVMKPRASSRKPSLMRIAATLAVLVTGAGSGWGLHEVYDQRTNPRLNAPPTFVERAVGAHLVYASEIRHPVEVAANQEKHLVAWLSKRLGSPLHPPHLRSAGYNLVGGRLLEESGAPAAQFMYEDNAGKRVTVYLRTYTGQDTAFKFFHTENASTFYWMDAPFAYALTGDLPRQDLLNIAHTVYEDLAP